MNTTYFLNLVSGNMFRTKTSPAIPTKYYLGLSRTAPNMNGGNVSEPPAAANYARVELKNLSAPTDGVVSNTSNIDFAESSAGWGVVTHFVVYDALTGGNLLMYGTLTASRTVEAATVMTIKSGGLTLSAVNPA